MDAKFFLLIMLLSSFNHVALAKEKAFVKFVRGKVTKLVPGKLEASPIKKNEWLVDGTSIVTSSRSMIRLVFTDKSSMNIGPKSKIVLAHLPKTKANMVNLLTGMIKAKVQKKSNKKSKTKLLVKTRTAVMGVRGTKFQSTYNAVNKTTSLVTVEGKVAMAKVKESPKYVANDSVGKAKVKSPAQLEKMMDTSADVVEVPAGRYSGVAQKVAKPTVPVKIAPTQYNAIAKSMGSKKKAADVMKITDADPDPRGFSDLKNGKLAPKAGGLLDFATGIYVPPAKNAKFDKKTGTFKAKSIGKVNRKTGDYIPPKGIKIDEKKGFVLDVKKGAKLASLAAIKKKVAKLNKSVEKQVVVTNKIENKAKKVDSNWKWLPKDHILSFQIMPYSQRMEIKTKYDYYNPDMKNDVELDSQDANFTLFKWKQVWNKKWSSEFTMGGQNYDIIDEDIEMYQHGEDQEGGYFSMGLIYQYSQALEITADLVEKTMFYVVPSDYMGPSGEMGAELRSDETSSIDLGLRYTYKNWEKFDLVFGGKLHFFGDSEIPYWSGSFGPDMDPVSYDKADMFGITLNASSLYSWRKNLMLRSQLWFNTTSAEAEKIEYHHRSTGIGFEFIWDV